MTTTDDERSVMLREIGLQPDFVRDATAAVVERTLAALADAARPVGPILVTGCGDSLIAGMAMRDFLADRTGRWTEALQALELARYRPMLPSNAVVLGVSNSGSVALTIEAVAHARERGAWTFGVTVGTENQLARTAETVVALDAPPNIKTREDGTKLVTPGTLTYTASLVGLVGAALALGRHVGALDEPLLAAELAQMLALADAMERTIGALDATLAQLAGALAPDRTTVFLGGGPNEATARYGAAKWYEALQWPAHAAHVEEWAHEQYFFTGKTTDLIALAPPGESFTRACEQIEAARAMGARTIALCPAHAARAVPADLIFPLPDDIPEALTPFVYAIPLQLLAAHLARVHDRHFFGFDDPERQAVNFRQIFTPNAVP